MTNSRSLVSIHERSSKLVTDALLDIVGHIPNTSEHQKKEPLAAAQLLTRIAARKAAMTSSSLALAPGPLGLFTLLPDLIAVWKIQSQLVSDIAAVYGAKGHLTKEHMLYCLFRHTASQALRDVVVRAGERFLIKNVSVGLLQKTAQKIGLQISKKVVGSGVSRFLPVLGAIGVGAYAYYDTAKVAATAIELFEAGVEVGPTTDDDSAPAHKEKSPLPI